MPTLTDLSEELKQKVRQVIGEFDPRAVVEFKPREHNCRIEISNVTYEQYRKILSAVAGKIETIATPANIAVSYDHGK